MLYSVCEGIGLNICHQNPLFSRNSIVHILYFSLLQNSHVRALEPPILAVLIADSCKEWSGNEWGWGWVEEERDFSRDLMKPPGPSSFAAIVDSG